MQITSDNFSLYIALVSAALSCMAYLLIACVPRAEAWDRLARFARVCYYTSFASIAYASIYLFQQILSNSRYDIAYIRDFSSANDALIYRISSFWAGQEGSLLLWTLMGAAIGVALVRKLDFKAPIIISFWSSIQAGLLMILVISDPFRKIANFQPGMLGTGLNPMLKNPWMAIHPPVIFLGYAALAVPAAFAVHALVKGESRKWANRSLPWALFGWVSLSAGLILGMVWSYEVLGWGGYWSWDPVENASFVPWLTATALVHGLLLQRYRGKMTRANIVLALATLLLVIYATFLTRSGVLADISVHSFVKSPVYPYLRGILIFYSVFCSMLLVLRLKSISASDSELKLRSKDFTLIVGAIILVVFAMVVLIGTSYSTFAKASMLDSGFYNHMSVPLAAAIIALIIFSVFAKWGGEARSKPLRSGSYIAHTGVVMLILGIVCSINGQSKNLTLAKNGHSKRMFGYNFTYNGRTQIGMNKEILNIEARNGVNGFNAPLSVEYSQSKSFWTPYIHSSIAGDLYISPVEIQSMTVTPTASLDTKGWVASPIVIPGTNSTLTLVGMQVESQMAKLRYRKSPKSAPVEIVVKQGEPVRVGNDLLSFKGFTSSGDGSAMGLTAGVKVGIEGAGHLDKMIIKLTTKPFIWLLWFGCVLILLGGVMAVVFRRMENSFMKSIITD